jgi:hypothetical protein
VSTSVEERNAEHPERTTERQRRTLRERFMVGGIISFLELRGEKRTTKFYRFFSSLSTSFFIEKPNCFPLKGASGEPGREASPGPLAGRRGGRGASVPGFAQNRRRDFK